MIKSDCSAWVVPPIFYVNSFSSRIYRLVIPALRFFIALTIMYYDLFGSYARLLRSWNFSISLEYEPIFYFDIKDIQNDSTGTFYVFYLIIFPTNMF